MRRSLSCLVFAALLPVAFGQATSREDPIQTSRPDFTTSPQIVPVGSLQLETGFSRYGKGGGEPQRWEFGEATLRYGLRRTVELRVDLPNYVLSLPRSAPDGFDDTTITASLYLGQIGGIDFGILPGVIVPTGRPDLRQESLAPTFSLLLRRDLGGDSDLSGALRVDFVHDEGRRVEQTTATLSYTHPLVGGLSGFIEYAGFFDRLSRPRNLAHTGVTLAVGRTSQLDLHGGFGLNEDSERFFVGAGYSVRF